VLEQLFQINSLQQNRTCSVSARLHGATHHSCILIGPIISTTGETFYVYIITQTTSPYYEILFYDIHIRSVICVYDKYSI